MPNRSSKRKPKRSTKRRRLKPEPDVNQVAHWIVSKTTSVDPEKNPHAVALGQLGGLKGGRARADKLTAEQRSEIASKAARTRWKTGEVTPSP